MTLMVIAEFIAKSDLKKVAVGVYFWTTLLAFKARFPALLGDEYVGELLMLIIVAVFAGNVLTHFIRSRYPGKLPDASAPAAKVVA